MQTCEGKTIRVGRIQDTTTLTNPMQYTKSTQMKTFKREMQ